VFLSDIVNVGKLTQNITPEQLVEILKRHVNHMTGIIEQYSGALLQCVGDAVLAFWHPKHSSPSHAQLAFDASREVFATLPDLFASQKHLTYDVDIVLGTGAMAGALFGPAKRFQVMGKAMAIGHRLSKARDVRGSSIRMSQYTRDLIDPQDA